MTLLLTTRCNLACAYCTQSRHVPRDMDAETLEAAVELVARSGHARPELVLFGGEPLLAGELVRRALALLSERARPGLAPSVRIVTNGLRLDDAATEQLFGRGVSLDLSCDGLGEAQERRGPGTSSALRALLLRLASRWPGELASRVVVRTTIDSGNVAYLAQSVEDLVGLGVRNVLPAPVISRDAGWDEAAAETLDRQLGRIAESALRREPAEGRWAFGPFRAGPRRGAPLARPSCSAGRPDVLFVDVDGSVAPCGAMAESVHTSLPPLGEAIRAPLRGVRVGQTDLERRLARRAATASRIYGLRRTSSRRSPRGPCATCPALGECFVCPASIAFAPEQDPDLVPAIQCDWNRLVAKHRRAFLARVPAREEGAQREGRRSSAAATSAVTPVRIAGP